MKNSIKSFSKARSRSSLKNKRLLSIADKTIIWSEENFKDFNFLFNDPAKLNLEIGFGDGIFLFDQALNNLDESFIGIEVFESGLTNTYKKIKKSNLKNLKLINGDVIQILSTNKSKNLFDLIIILFPDPWPKSKHKKRRLLKSDFFIVLQSLLKKDGKIIIKTDWQDYAEEIRETLNKLDYQHTHIYETSNLKELKTKYEKIALKENRSINKFLIPSIR
ncbi:MAG: tRNA (guanosine(46)-N7)-methyltransferase TrmB [Gammaproteobacteria bacterium]|nr:tRNA (guanosine(46)-N7)-methyltransferase TrmB [Gammaproteobacteria bacterium]